MPQERLSNDEFFARLTTLLTSATNAHQSSVFLTQKPLTPAGVEPTTSLLLRATDGKTDASKKVKIATVVEIADLEGFYARYADVMKAGLGSLKKRDRKAKKNKLKAKKGKGGKAEEKST